MRIPHTTEVVANCWLQAESRVRASVADKHYGVGETWITDTFRGELRDTCARASANREIENAFLRDLEEAFPHLQLSVEMQQIPRGLVAQVVFHGNNAERMSGGDLGVMLSRPDVRGESYEEDNTLVIERHVRRALLAQAKLGKWDNRGQRFRWRHKLTARQVKLFPDRSRYLSLLLYRYLDEELRVLDDFVWQHCHGHQAGDVKRWLNDDKFPQECASGDVLRGLAEGVVGSDDPGVIDGVIAPSTQEYLEIRIDWPAMPPPGRMTVECCREVSEESKQVVYVQQR